MKKTITYIINSLEIGGTEKQLLQLIKEIKKKFYVKILCFKKGKLYKFFAGENIEIISLEEKKITFLSLIKFLYKNKTDIYHFLLPKSYIFCSLLLLFSKKKKIMSRRSLNYYHKKYFYISLLVEKLLHKTLDLIIVNSEDIKLQLIKKENVSEKKIKLIENFFVKEKKLKKNNLILPDKKNGEVFFIYIANFIPYKGHINLLKICSKIDVNRNWKLLFIGEDRNKFKNQIINCINKFKLKKNVLIFKPCLEVFEFYKLADFAVTTSSEEGSSNFLLESVSLGLPIISYDVGGNRNFHNGKNGFLIKFQDEINFKKKIEKMINLNDRKNLSKNSLLIFKKRKNNKDLAEQYFESYNS